MPIEPPAAPRKKQPTRRRVVEEHLEGHLLTTPTSTQRKLAFGDGDEFDSPDGGGVQGLGSGGVGTTPASPPMTRGRASGGKEPKTPPVSKIKSMPR